MTMKVLKDLVRLPRRTKKALFIIHDVFLISLSFWLAISLRVGVVWAWADWHNWLLLGIIAVFSLLSFDQIGLYRTVVRYAGLKVIQKVLFGSIISVFVMLLATFFMHAWLPRSVPISYFLLLTLFLVGSRFTVKGLLQSEQRNRNHPILIYGAGKSGRQVLASTLKIGDFLPVAFVDDDQQLQQTKIQNRKVYSPEQIPHLLEHYGVETIVLALPEATQPQKQAVINHLSDLPCKVLSVPNNYALNLLGEAAGIRMLEKISVIDLLGRDAIKPIEQLMHRDINDKVVMVTGAGGSIGSELCRQIVRQSPKTLLLFELSEYSLYQIDLELTRYLKDSNTQIKIIPVLGSVQHPRRLQAVMKQYGVQTIYHAAAYKHVPLVEYNSVEGVRNNVFGTLECAQAAIEANVETFVLISTDKAVRPTNTMGATKRVAELILQALAEENSHQTRFCMVRFGNVLGSSGSVIPLFEQQIAQGGPITVTHPEITRYFMTIPEAAQLVIQAGAMGKGGDVFVLDMGEPVKIIDLAKQMVLLSGMRLRDRDNPTGDIEIAITGLRSGEKLYEELLIGNEAAGTVHPRIMTTKEKMLSWSSLSIMLGELRTACDDFSANDIRDILLSAPVDFQPTDGVYHLDKTAEKDAVLQ